MKTHLLKLFLLLILPLFGCGDRRVIHLAPPAPVPPVVVQPTPPPDNFWMDTEWSDEPFEWNYKASGRTLKWNSLRWNRRDLYIKYRGGKKTLGFFSTVGRSEYKKLLAEGETARHCSQDHSFRLLAVVGNIISFEHGRSKFGNGCTGSVYSDWRFASIDLGKKGGISYPDLPDEWREPVMLSSTSMLSLTEFFDEKDILAALLANPRVVAEISENGAQTPASLKEFVKFFTESRYNFDDVFSLERDFLLRFVFRGIENDRVKVWFSLEPHPHSLQALQDYLEISLPIPERLRKPLLAADSCNQGFLMKDAKAILGSGFSEYEFGPAVEFVPQTEKQTSFNINAR